MCGYPPIFRSRLRNDRLFFIVDQDIKRTTNVVRFMSVKELPAKGRGGKDRAVQIFNNYTF